MRLQLAALLVLAASGTAAAYPQFQLSRDQTCSGCHISPAGGGLLNENGFNTAESISQYGTAPEFFYNKVPTPAWLELGGDIRGAAGFVRTPQNEPAAIPMQAELYVHATFSHIQLHADVGVRPPEHEPGGGADAVDSSTYVWSREHYIEYQQNVGGTDGLFVRVGRFMPVFGLRQVEHVDYNREFGGTPLYSERYGASISYIKPKYELHLSGFIKNDPIVDPVNQDNGVAAYAEYRTSEKTSLGLEYMASWSDDDKHYRYGVTAKHYFPSEDALVQFEGQFVNQVIDVGGGAPLQIVAYLMVSKFLGKAFLVDFGGGHYDEDVRVSGLARDAGDVNIHWFTTSHLELIWTNRVELTTGPTGAWSLLQLHYRL